MKIECIMCNVRRIAVFVSVVLLQIITMYGQSVDTTKLSKQLKIIYDIVDKSAIGIDNVVVLDSAIAVENPDSCWREGIFLQVGFSQLSLTNWAAGGFSSVALNTYADIYSDYAKDLLFWESRLQIAYGFIKSFGDRYKKSDDKFIFDTKVGYRLKDDMYAFSFLNIRTQMTNGYIYPKDKDPELVSSIFSPAYISLGLGIDYKPLKSLSINFSPLTSGATIITMRELREKYGNRLDQPVKMILGARFNVDYKGAINDKFSIETALSLFSDYLHKPKNIKVNWDLFVNTQITKYISVNFRANLIYDDEIKIGDKDGNLASRVQFKEILAIGFSYTFGQQKNVDR